MSQSNDSETEVVDFDFTLSEREVSFDIDEELYAIDAIYSASYLFIDRAYVFLARPADKKVRVRLRSKGEATPAELEALAGEFANELLNSQLRFRLGRATAGIREQYMARAFFGQRQSSTIAELLAELDSEELAEDPLEIAVPWEEQSKTPETAKSAPENDG
jgi:His-Xaa-Ser system protein HxsD